MAIFAQRFFCLVCCFSLLSPARAEIVPNVRFQDTFGNARNVASLRGSVTVVTFWATWCIPCEEELPRLQDLQHLYAKQKVHFVLISVDDADSQAKAAMYLRQRHLAFDSWFGGDRSKLAELDLGSAVPATMVIDRNGDVVGRIKGPAHDEDIGIYLDWVLGGRKGQRPDTVIERY